MNKKEAAHRCIATFAAAINAKQRNQWQRFMYKINYYINDYQGNVRLVVNDSCEVESYNSYYSYGGPFEGENATSVFQPHMYNGKEYDHVHGLDWYDYGARHYDPAMARFTQMDPLSEQYPHLSPYAYCAGNPVNAVDPDGRKFDFSQMSKKQRNTFIPFIGAFQ